MQPSRCPDYNVFLLKVSRVRERQEPVCGHERSLSDFVMEQIRFLYLSFGFREVAF